MSWSLTRLAPRVPPHQWTGFVSHAKDQGSPAVASCPTTVPWAVDTWPSQNSRETRQMLLGRGEAVAEPAKGKSFAMRNAYPSNVNRTSLVEQRWLQGCSFQPPEICFFWQFGRGAMASWVFNWNSLFNMAQSIFRGFVADTRYPEPSNGALYFLALATRTSVIRRNSLLLVVPSGSSLQRCHTLRLTL